MSARLRPLTDFLISGLLFCLSKSSFSVLQTHGKVLNGVTIKIVSWVLLCWYQCVWIVRGIFQWKGYFQFHTAFGSFRQYFQNLHTKTKPAYQFVFQVFLQGQSLIDPTIQNVNGKQFFNFRNQILFQLERMRGSSHRIGWSNNSGQFQSERS